MNLSEYYAFTCQAGTGHNNKTDLLITLTVDKQIKGLYASHTGISWVCYTRKKLSKPIDIQFRVAAKRQHLIANTDL
ncbi:MAG: hypothetical protein CR991_04195 [Proteobacteria bacterium]|nr:MAG: hypothetical protein CR991_04195 [Pseudomonadota bacterium]